MNKEKCFKVLKNCLLEQTCGAGIIMDEPIEFLIEVYCELTNTSKDDFLNNLQDIEAVAWSNFNDNKEWKSRQNVYERLIDTLEIK